MGIFLNIFTVDLWETKFFDFLDPIKQAPEFVNFSEYNLIFSELSYIFENTVSPMIWDHKHETVSSTTRKSLEGGMEYCYESISEIRKVPFIFKILKNKFNVKIFLINLYGYQKISEFT